MPIYLPMYLDLSVYTRTSSRGTAAVDTHARVHRHVSTHWYRKTERERGRGLSGFAQQVRILVVCVLFFFLICMLRIRKEDSEKSLESSPHEDGRSGLQIRVSGLPFQQKETSDCLEAARPLEGEEFACGEGRVGSCVFFFFLSCLAYASAESSMAWLKPLSPP